jgi:autotransporter-associated beta strand protein
VGGFLLKDGTGNLTLAAANTFNGSTRIFSTGTLTLSDPLALQNSPLDTTSSQPERIVLSGVTSPTFGGLTGNKQLSTMFTASGNYGSVDNVTLNPGTGASYSYSGILDDGAADMTLTKTGPGLQILNAVNSYTGGTILIEGILRYDNLSALSTGPISFTGNATLRTGVSGNLTNAISLATGVTASFGSNSLSPTLSGAITGEGALAKIGTGTLNITGGNTDKTLSGPINVSVGTLAIDNVSPSPAFQSFANMNGDITVASGATFDFSQSFQAAAENNLDNNITISGPGVGPKGALHLWRNATASGTITLAENATISHDFNRAIINGTITATNRTLTLTTLTNNQPGIEINGPIQLGTGGITINGAANNFAGGDFSVKLSGTNSYTGETHVVTGKLWLSGDARINDSATLRINSGAVVNLDFTGTDKVASLILDGVSQGLGTYGSLASDATNKSAFFEGGGIIEVAVPANNYNSWATTNGIAGEPFDADFNGDGISNGVAYALGLSPTASSQPAGLLSGNTITFTKGADAIANADVSWIIETSLTLSGSWTTEVTQPAGDTTPTISYDLAPAPGTPKKFARLKVVQAQ